MLSADKTRMSISGWFHGPPVPRPSPYKEIGAPMSSPVYLPVSCG